MAGTRPPAAPPGGRRARRARCPVNPFRRILQLSAGDFVAKALNFFTFVYLARTLGVAPFGVLEFARSIVTYALLVSDGGLELWATREVARGRPAPALVARVVAGRAVLAAGAFGSLLAIGTTLPPDPMLRSVLGLYGLALFSQALSLKWAFIGQERMTRVATGLLVAQVTFAAAVFAVVRRPEHLVWVPVAQVAGDLAMAWYFWHRFTREYGRPSLAASPRETWDALKPAAVLGASQMLGLLSFNFDAILLGFLAGSTAVGVYSAAYRPVTVVLAIPVTYFIWLFPALARAFASDARAAGALVARSLRLAAIVAPQIGVGGAFLAGPIIQFLFGPAYVASAPVLQILAWSASLVILRGTYRQAFTAAGRQRLDLACAGTATGVNVVLNVALIPTWGVLGAALATVSSELLWLTLAAFFFARRVAPLPLVAALGPPVVAAAAMAGCLALSRAVAWPLRAALGLGVYGAALALMGVSRRGGARRWRDA